MFVEKDNRFHVIKRVGTVYAVAPLSNGTASKLFFNDLKPATFFQ